MSAMCKFSVVAVALVTCACGRDDTSITDGESACGPPYATVSRVIDGDTIEFTDETRVRIIGIDAPERHNSDDTRQPECYAEEATAYLRGLVEGREVALRYDGAGCEDRYGRTLAHIDAPDGDVATLLVSRGYACAYAVPPVGDNVRQQLHADEVAAQHDGRGLWLACTLDLPECAQ